MSFVVCDAEEFMHLFSIFNILLMKNDFKQEAFCIFATMSNYCAIQANKSFMIHSDTICAIATAQGKGAIAVIRVSGTEALSIASKIFKPKKKNVDFRKVDGHSLLFGEIVSGERIIDEVVLSVFRNPKSFTGEDIIEISCHASGYIQQSIISQILDNGARMAQPGEFTLRAFLNGKMDLSQAEAVADIISSSSEAAHRLAMSQMRGGYAEELQFLRQKLLDFVSLIELELDFSEEDVEFADRTQLAKTCDEIEIHLSKLVDSFSMGNAIKNGIPVAIVGDPNVGKSTLLNALLNEEKAIVSEIPGTTRDVIEDVLTIGGVNFRFIDTAGIRQTSNTIETLGIKKTFEKIKQSAFVLLLIDVTAPLTVIKGSIAGIKKEIGDDKRLILVVNKIDKLNEVQLEKRFSRDNYSDLADEDSIILISAKFKQCLDVLRDKLVIEASINQNDQEDVMVTNQRHYEALKKALESIIKVKEGLETGITNDFVSMDIRQVLHYLGEITGHISNDEMLGNIFANFCIGK